MDRGLLQRSILDVSVRGSPNYLRNDSSSQRRHPGSLHGRRFAHRLDIWRYLSGFQGSHRRLGCLLGGFCLSMWFLVLKPGGLIADSTGRAIMIGVFCVVGWSLSFSQYTRNYGLIGCTAFGGAMIAILGVDCFSRAGLKEFWLYIWGKSRRQ
jgi:hypothetical protein